MSATVGGILWRWIPSTGEWYTVEETKPGTYVYKKREEEDMFKCVECGGDHGLLRHGEWLRVEALKENERVMGAGCAECHGPTGYEDPLTKLREERGSYYGDVAINHGSIGAIWGGILVQAASSGRWRVGEVVPPDIVCLMMVGVKMSREAYRHKTDNIDDAQNYLDFVEELIGKEVK